MRRLVCTCVVRKPPKTGFLASMPISYRRQHRAKVSTFCRRAPLGVIYYQLSYVYFQPLKKRSLDNHIEDYPRFRAKVRSVSSAREDSCFTCLRTAVHCYNIVILVSSLIIGVAPISQLRTCMIKIVTFKGGQLML